MGTDPDAYPFPSDEIANFAPGTSVSVSNSYTAPNRVEIGQRAYCDLAHFTDTSVKMVQRELSKKGLSVIQAGGRTMRLRMTYPTLVIGAWSMRARVRLEAELGNGETIAVDGESKTGGNAMRAFNGAILRAVTALLQEPRIAAYLNGQSGAA
ncbi:MAG TPA: hypothetical protein VEL28_12855 [Candidatus Binatia bacterium]|nr:hypothetical protein [Candidatus Binatia bacterium]